jgi:hypothetical protein
MSEYDRRIQAIIVSVGGQSGHTSIEASEQCEKTASDAPSWYNSEEASAWANGYNAAVASMTERHCSD